MDIDQDFESAFAEAMGEPVEAADVQAPVEDAPAPDVTVEGEPPVEAVETDEPEAAVEPEPAEEAPEPVAAEPAPAPQPQIDPKYLAMAIAEAQQLAAQQQQPAPAAPEAPKAASYEDFLSPEQKTALQGFQTEWADVAAPVSVLINAHVQAALANQQREILTQVQQQMAPVAQFTAQSQEALHWNTIQAAHPDFREVAGGLPAWIESQPKFLQREYQRVLQQGSTAEAVELLSTYKQATGVTGAAPAQPASSAVQAPPKAPVSKAALAATAAVPPAQRSKVVTAKDPNDPEAAFAEAFATR
ncbi:hypothetical protein D3C85_285620 [compost metagenome]